ncbi:F-box protein CPR1-like [Nicotiana tabacum]|uniref:F-box protein CPR1-like n=1 Tax=Nicotiana tabacum TaxID=4097 RepID=A0A1S3YZ91_TOBAC|nr:PREDICTED: F-box protein CPR30-like [Nicotiana tabacum]
MVHGIMKKLLEDVFIYILLKLPVKSIMRFKCISKTWYILMQSSTFINLHLNRSTKAKDELILFKRSFQEDPFQHKTILSFLFGVDDGYLYPVSPDLDVPYLESTFSSTYDQFIGPCQGLIALINIVDTVLFNPATRNYRLVPPCPFGVPQGFRRYVDGVGFGFDSIANDYKVIRISEVYNDPPYRDPFTREVKVEVYDMSTDSWREMEHVNQEMPRVYWAPCSLVFYNSACHWLAIAPKDKMTILCFDMSTETFNNINMPNTCNSYNGPCYGLVVLDESITMIRYPNTNPEYDAAQDLMQIWIMKRYGVYESWIKKYTIRPLPIESPLAIWKDRMMLLQSRKCFLISYDPKFDKVKELYLHGCPRSLRAISYRESLIQIPCGSENSTQVQKF